MVFYKKNTHTAHKHFFKLCFFQLCSLVLLASGVDGLCSLCQVNPCSVARCEHFSKCIPGGMFNYTCECSTFWSGEFCENPSSINPCFSSPCKQGSECLHDPAFNTYKCLCQPGYTGSACNVLIDVCASFPCTNGGRCGNRKNGVVTANYYECICPSGFTGFNCEVVINLCESNPCLNGAICIPGKYIDEKN